MKSGRVQPSLRLAPAAQLADSGCLLHLPPCCLPPSLPIHPHLPPPQFPTRTTRCRYSYGSYRPYAKEFRELQARHSSSSSAAEEQAAPASLPAPVRDLDPAVDDAFATVMGWLYSRIDATR